MGGEVWTPGPCPLQPAPPHGPSLETEARTEGHGGLSSFLPSPGCPLPSAARPTLSGGGRQTQNHRRGGAAAGPARRGLTGLQPLWSELGLSSLTSAWPSGMDGQPDILSGCGRLGQKVRPTQQHPWVGTASWFRGPVTGREAGESGLQPGKAVGSPGTSCSGADRALLAPEPRFRARDFTAKARLRVPAQGPALVLTAPGWPLWAAGGCSAGKWVLWFPASFPGDRCLETVGHTPQGPRDLLGGCPTPGDHMPELWGHKREGRQA